MSICISKYGEYSSHTPHEDEEFVCELCAEIDVEAMRARLSAAETIVARIQVREKAIVTQRVFEAAQKVRRATHGLDHHRRYPPSEIKEIFYAVAMDIEFGDTHRNTN